jgi:hydrogenase nickel incorporation protein HypB
MLLSKADLLPFKEEAERMQELNPDLEVITISTKQGEGIDDWCNWLMKKGLKTKKHTN